MLIENRKLDVPEKVHNIIPFLSTKQNLCVSVHICLYKHTDNIGYFKG